MKVIHVIMLMIHYYRDAVFVVGIISIFIFEKYINYNNNDITIVTITIDEAREANEAHHHGRDLTADPIALKLREAAVCRRERVYVYVCM